MIAKDFLRRILSRHISSAIEVRSSNYVSGGCINTTLKVDTNHGSFFIKINSKNEADLFEKEVLGLDFLQDRSPISTPTVIGSGTIEDKVYLILEWIDKTPTNQSFWRSFGQALAEQHLITNDAFGLEHDNHIGRLSQPNGFRSNWYDFFVEERLLTQLKIARNNGLIDMKIQNQFEGLFSKLDSLIPPEAPALLHGDLWSGNFLCAKNGEAFIFDPAIYFGHRETELAFTTLFGGFDALFYDAYEQVKPLEQGFEDRIELHNLYPLLVHVNLFGPSYLSAIKNTLKRFT